MEPVRHEIGGELVEMHFALLVSEITQNSIPYGGGHCTSTFNYLNAAIFTARTYRGVLGPQRKRIP